MYETQYASPGYSGALDEDSGFRLYSSVRITLRPSKAMAVDAL